MRSTTYEAVPGSIPFRVLAYLGQQDKGAEVPTGTLAHALGITTSQISASLLPVVKAGALFGRQKGGHPKSPFFWSLVNHGPSAPVVPRASAVTLADVAAGLPREGRARLSPGTNGIEGAASATPPEGRSEAAPAAQATGEREGGATPNDGAPAADATVQTPQFLPPGTVRPAPMRPRQTQQRYREEVAADAPAVDAITLTVRVANLHQAERVMQLVREMQA